jgi:carboxymethylenebutenolidase
VIDTVVSAGKPVRVERFEPTGRERAPVVVLLHGLDGLEENGDKIYRPVARHLARRGYVVLLAHYFDRTGTKKDDLPRLLKRFRAYLEAPPTPNKRSKEVLEAFKAWLATVGDVIGHARKLPRGDPDRVALVGVSLGGFLAVTAAAQPAWKVRCVVELFGGLPAERASEARRLPPTLIVHGDRDEVVPVRHAHALRALLRRHERPHQVEICRGSGHGFVKPDGGVCWLTILRAQVQAERFLARHLSVGVTPGNR